MPAPEQIAEAIKSAARPVQGKLKLNCAAAFEIAARFEVTPATVGRICNQQNIRISNCQLGCFK